MATQRDIRRLRSLKTGKGRRESNQYAAEGVRLLEESRRHGVDPEVLYFDPGALSDRGRRLLDDLRAHGSRCEEIAKKQLESAADTKTPQGLIGVFNYPEISLAPLKICRRLLICDGISDPGNVGTLIRSAQAFDFDAVLLTGDTGCPDSQYQCTVRVKLADAVAIEFGAIDVVVRVDINPVGGGGVQDTFAP